MADINEKFQAFLQQREQEQVFLAVEQYENGTLDESGLLRTISPALTRALQTTFNSPKIEKAVRHYIKIRKEFKDNHTALRAAASETDIDYRTLQKILVKMISKGLVPKEMSISEEFDGLEDLINTMDEIVNEIEQ